MIEDVPSPTARAKPARQKKAATPGPEAGKTQTASDLVTLPYAPRPAFLPFHERTQRFAVLVCHRRAGKTVATINDLVRRAIECERPAPRYAYIAPLFRQAKDIAWDYLKRYTAPIPGRVVNEGELRIDLPGERRIRLYGADNPDTLRGLYLDGVVIDEPAQMKPALWQEVLRPALADRNGFAVFIGTPKGRNWVPDRKVLAGGIAGVAAWAVMLGLQHFDIAVPADTQTMIVAVIGWAIAYLVPPADQDIIKRLNERLVAMAQNDPSIPVKPPVKISR